MMFEHTSVMPSEVHKYLALKAGDSCVDCTLGGSGHASKMIEAVLPGGRLIGIDQDIDAVDNAKAVLSPFSSDVKIFHDNFVRLPRILDSLEIKGVDAILLDLGLSLHQLRQGKRGFSFKQDEPLDMRMDTREGMTAEDIINSYEEKALADLFFSYGEERLSRRIAKQIVLKRKASPIQTSSELAGVVVEAVPARLAAKQRIHPATRVFQALRIAVNRELERLALFLKALPAMLNTGGRVCIIAFHSLEDRMVKQQFRAFESGCTCPREFPVCACGFTPQLRVLHKKAIKAGEDEIRLNPMARSARLRIAQKI